MRTKATLADLYCLPDKGKADLVHEKLIIMAPTGGVPGQAGGTTYKSLDHYEHQTKHGYAFPDNVGSIVDLPHPQSFSPDAAFYIGEL